MTARDLPRRAATQLATVLAATDVALGAVLATEPHRRLTGPGLTTALQVMPALAWGTILALAGVLALLAQRSARDAALWLAAAWYAFFSITLIDSAVHLPNAGLLGVVLYPSMLILHTLAGTRRVR